MVKKLIFKNSSGTIIQEEDFIYNPETQTLIYKCRRLK